MLKDKLKQSLEDSESLEERVYRDRRYYARSLEYRSAEYAEKLLIIPSR